MPLPRFCTNPACRNSSVRPSNWLIRDGAYLTAAHGLVQRYKCRRCGKGLSTQTESIYYAAKLRLDLRRVYSRLRGGSSQRDIAREIGCSRKAIGNAVLRLGRQSMAAHINLFCGLKTSGRVCFDGLVSAVTARDYPSQITTLGDSETELILAMTHCITERGGTRTKEQAQRMSRKRQRWRPSRGSLSESISLLVRELAGFGSGHQIHIDTDEHPLYAPAIKSEPRLRWHRMNELLTHRQTPGSAPRTGKNPLFLMNYIDRMIRHRMKEHTRETIAVGRESNCQMHRMWIFAHDHNTRQPVRVAGTDRRSRAEIAGVPKAVLQRVRREFYTRRLGVHRLPVPESMRRVWKAELDTPPVRWRVGQRRRGPVVTQFALRDLSCAHPHDW
jgi:transposase-like protein